MQSISLRCEALKMALMRIGCAAAIGLANLGLGVGDAAAAEQPVRGGTLTIALVPEPSHLNSAFDTSPQVVMVSTKTNEGLLSYDLNLNPIPQLAESWTV